MDGFSAGAVPVKLVSERLGHTSPTVYAHVLPGNQRAAATSSPKHKDGQMVGGEAAYIVAAVLTGGGGTADGAIAWTDWVDVVAAVAGIAAVIFAIVTVRQTAKGSEENLKALRVERRIDFELDVLSTLAEYNEHDHHRTGVDARITTLARMLPQELIPLTRAAADLPSTPEAMAAVAEQKPKAHEVRSNIRSYMRKTLADEIHEAIEMKLRERK